MVALRAAQGGLLAGLFLGLQGDQPGLQRGNLGGLLFGIGLLLAGLVQRASQPVGFDLQGLGVGCGKLLVFFQRAEIFLGLGLFGQGV